jgi:hypothetical protein
MFTSFLLGTFLAGGGTVPAAVPDLGAVKCGIVKEPAYRGAPRYCLLVFGKDTPTRIWLVQDGDTLYVDRNGNGDLTEAGKKVTATEGRYFAIDRLLERDGTVHSTLRLTNFPGGTFNIHLGGQEERAQYVGIAKMDRPSWGDRPENAPVIHFNGPLTLERYGPVLTLPRMVGESDSRRYKLQLMLGTPGQGKGTFASFNETCSENLGPVQADIEYANRDPKGPPIKQRIDLEHDG